MFWIILSVILALISLRLALRLAAYRKNVREIKNELILTKNFKYNRLITIDLLDKDLAEMTAQINHNLDYQKQLKYETERAERNLKQSVSDIAHDFRTPLTVIKGNLQLISSDEKISENGSRYLRVCSEKADYMKQMADDFFELALLESDLSCAEMSRINATTAIMQFIADNESVIRCSGLEPEIIFPEKSVFIFADEMLVMRMLGNLLNNILRYAEDSFTLKLDEEGNISLSNRIKGAVPDVSRLFDRTYRADKSRSSKGTGLGLYIVKLLARKQGADVFAEINDNMLTFVIKFRKSAD